jgi:signal transduction histidine kinase
MQLPEFIRQTVDEVVEEWAEFAQSSIPAAEHLQAEELRDDSREILLSIADDMDAEQSDTHRYEKSRGKRPDHGPEVTKSARDDADERLLQGFSLTDVVAEYRALRASVVRRWLQQLDSADLGSLRELVRFNEAMDQAITESIKWYMDRIDESRNLLLGVLGHDLRNPLGAIRLSADYLLRSEGPDPVKTKAAVRIQSSAARMRQMVDDLLDFTRTRMGGNLPIHPVPANMAELCREVVDELEAFHPDRRIVMHCTGEMHGQWDVRRIAQLASNLVSNAIQHGRPDRPVTVTLDGEETLVRLRVHNEGRPIAPGARQTLFDPLMRPVSHDPQARQGSSGLGLGLHIVREVARAHGGHVRVESSEEDGTSFEVCLPRMPGVRL